MHSCSARESYNKQLNRSGEEQTFRNLSNPYTSSRPVAMGVPVTHHLFTMDRQFAISAAWVVPSTICACSTDTDQDGSHHRLSVAKDSRGSLTKVHMEAGRTSSRTTRHQVSLVRGVGRKGYLTA